MKSSVITASFFASRIGIFAAALLPFVGYGATWSYDSATGAAALTCSSGAQTDYRNSGIREGAELDAENPAAGTFSGPIKSVTVNAWDTKTTTAGTEIVPTVSSIIIGLNGPIAGSAVILNSGAELASVSLSDTTLNANMNISGSEDSAAIDARGVGLNMSISSTLIIVRDPIDTNAVLYGVRSSGTTSIVFYTPTISTTSNATNKINVQSYFGSVGGVVSTGSLTIVGEGDITVVGGRDAVGILGHDTITATYATISATSTGSANAWGVKAEAANAGALQVGDITVSSNKDAYGIQFKSADTVTISTASTKGGIHVTGGENAVGIAGNNARLIAVYGNLSATTTTSNGAAAAISLANGIQNSVPSGDLTFGVNVWGGITGDINSTVDVSAVSGVAYGILVGQAGTMSAPALNGVLLKNITVSAQNGHSVGVFAGDLLGVDANATVAVDALANANALNLHGTLGNMAGTVIATSSTKDAFGISANNANVSGRVSAFGAARATAVSVSGTLTVSETAVFEATASTGTATALFAGTLIGEGARIVADGAHAVGVNASTISGTDLRISVSAPDGEAVGVSNAKIEGVEGVEATVSSANGTAIGLRATGTVSPEVILGDMTVNKNLLAVSGKEAIGATASDTITYNGGVYTATTTASETDPISGVTTSSTTIASNFSMLTVTGSNMAVGLVAKTVYLGKDDAKENAAAEAMITVNSGKDAVGVSVSNAVAYNGGVLDMSVVTTTVSDPIEGDTVTTATLSTFSALTVSGQTSAKGIVADGVDGEGVGIGTVSVANAIIDVNAANGTALGIAASDSITYSGGMTTGSAQTVTVGETVTSTSNMIFSEIRVAGADAAEGLRAKNVYLLGTENTQGEFDARLSVTSTNAAATGVNAAALAQVDNAALVVTAENASAIGAKAAQAEIGKTAITVSGDTAMGVTASNTIDYKGGLITKPDGSSVSSVIAVFGTNEATGLYAKNVYVSGDAAAARVEVAADNTAVGVHADNQAGINGSVAAASRNGAAVGVKARVVSGNGGDILASGATAATGVKADRAVKDFAATATAQSEGLAIGVDALEVNNFSGIATAMSTNGTAFGMTATTVSSISGTISATAETGDATGVKTVTVDQFAADVAATATNGNAVGMDISAATSTLSGGTISATAQTGDATGVKAVGLETFAADVAASATDGDALGLDVSTTINTLAGTIRAVSANGDATAVKVGDSIRSVNGLNAKVSSAGTSVGLSALGDIVIDDMELELACAEAIGATAAGTITYNGGTIRFTDANGDPTATVSKGLVANAVSVSNAVGLNVVGIDEAYGVIATSSAVINGSISASATEAGRAVGVAVGDALELNADVTAAAPSGTAAVGVYLQNDGATLTLADNVTVGAVNDAGNAVAVLTDGADATVALGDNANLFAGNSAGSVSGLAIYARTGSVRLNPTGAEKQVGIYGDMKVADRLTLSAGTYNFYGSTLTASGLYADPAAKVVLSTDADNNSSSIRSVAGSDGNLKWGENLTFTVREGALVGDSDSVIDAVSAPQVGLTVDERRIYTDMDGFDYTLETDADGVVSYTIQGMSMFEDKGSTENTKALGAALDSLEKTGDADADNAMRAFKSAFAVDNFDALAEAMLPSVASYMSQELANTMLNANVASIGRLASLRSLVDLSEWYEFDEFSDRANTATLVNLNNYTDQSGDSNLAGFSGYSVGALAAFDHMFSRAFIGGVSLGGGYVDISGNRNSGKGDAMFASANVYGDYAIGESNVDVFLGLGYAHSWNNSRRESVQNTRAKGEWDSDILSGFIGVAYTYRDIYNPYPEKFSVRPMVFLNVAYLSNGAYSETDGGSSALKVDSNNATSARGYLGVQGDYLLSEFWRLTARGFISYEMGDNQYNVNASFLDMPNVAFRTNGVEFGRFGGLLGLGTDYQLSETTNVFLNYNINVMDTQTNHGLNAGVRVQW